jgi:FtsP/CotA-like multicopper oxidase with cupredoxin domain
MLDNPQKTSMETANQPLANERKEVPTAPPTIIYQKEKQTPYWIFFGCIVAMVALLSYGIGAMITLNAQSGGGSSASSSGSNGTQQTMSTSSDTSNVPDATQKYGNQLATYTRDPDGAKHFTLTASQVMWDVTGGNRVLAWAINGTVPGPMIRVTAGDHVRITFINHFPKPTAVHWHGLLVDTQQDGVPGLGQNPIQPGQTHIYDFTVANQDIGTHWYHSHYDDAEQEPNGFYGAFIVDPQPGSPQAAQAIHADVEYDEFIGMMGGYYIMSGKSFPDTQPITIKTGQTVHLRLFGVDAMLMHPMHLHGHTFKIVAEDGHPLAQPIEKDTVQVAPGETYDLVFKAWAPAGSVYPFHCHILSHLMNPGQTGEQMGGLITLVKYV